MLQIKYNEFFKTLGNQIRLDIIYVLRDNPLNVTQLTEKLPYKQSSISHALKRLEKCHFVEVQVKGKFRVYKLNNETIKPLLMVIDKHVKKYCSKYCAKK